MEEIARAIMKLSIKQKRRLIVEVNRQIRQELWTGKINEILSIADLEKMCCDIVGLSEYDNSSRDRSNVTIAILMTRYLLDNGMTEAPIAMLIGKSDSTIYHYKHIMETWEEFPNIYAEETKYMNELKRRTGHETD